MTDRAISLQAAIGVIDVVLDRAMRAIADKKPMDAASALFLVNEALSALPDPYERDECICGKCGLRHGGRKSDGSW